MLFINIICGGGGSSNLFPVAAEPLPAVLQRALPRPGPQHSTSFTSHRSVSPTGEGP